MAYKSSYTGSQVDTAVQKVISSTCEVQYGNIIGNIEDQADLVDKFAACEIKAVLQGSSLVLKVGNEVQTFSGILSILNSKKYVYVTYSGNICVPASVSENLITFTSDSQTITHVTIDSNNAVTASTSQFESANNKVTSISNLSTNTQYPSAKAVYNFVQSSLGSINAALEEILGE